MYYVTFSVSTMLALFRSSWNCVTILQSSHPYVLMLYLHRNSVLCIDKGLSRFQSAIISVCHHLVGSFLIFSLCISHAILKTL